MITKCPGKFSRMKTLGTGTLFKAGTQYPDDSSRTKLLGKTAGNLPKTILKCPGNLSRTSLGRGHFVQGRYTIGSSCCKMGVDARAGETGRGGGYIRVKPTRKSSYETCT